MDNKTRRFVASGAAADRWAFLVKVLGVGAPAE
jgi:hypothetical protein